MKQKLVALAVASALAIPLTASAQDSSFTLFGRVQAELSSVDVDGLANSSQTSINDNAGQSRWGMHVIEGMGNGLKAIAHVEYAFRPGTNAPYSAREQWVALSGDGWGTLQFGRVHSPFKDFAGGVSIDPLSNTNLQARGSGAALYAPANGLGAVGFVNQAIRYNSPVWSGFSLSALFMPGNADQTDPALTANNTGGKGGGNDFQIALKYKYSVGEIFGGYSRDYANDAQRALVTNGLNGADEKVWRIGGAWSFGNLRLVGQFDRISNALAGTGGVSCGGIASTSVDGNATGQCNTSLNANGDGKILFLSGQYKLGNTTLVLQGGRTKADAVGAMNERTARNVTLAVIHSLSKRSRVFGGFQRVTVDGAHNVANTVSNGSGAVLAVQPDRSVWSIGVRHDF